jgi:proteasome lid subunit RPN8/RPN11
MLKLEPGLHEQIRGQAAEAYPEECCGFLLGVPVASHKSVQKLLVLPNSSPENRARRYVVSPDAYRSAEQAAEKEGFEILGIYHSHPDHPSRPSQFDLDHALPSWSYIIVSVDRGTSAEMSSWVLMDDRSAFASEELRE